MENVPDYSDISNDPIVEEQLERIPTILDDDFADKNLIVNHEVIDSAKVIWDIDSYSALPTRLNGPEVECGGYKWRALLFPNGNQGSYGAMSLYAEVVPPEDADDQWAVCAQFLLVLANREDPSVMSKHEAHHRFNKVELDWGYGKLYDPKTLAQKQGTNTRPLLEDDKITIALYVKVVKDSTGYLWSNFNNYDSKKATGYVGLLNQGATCYMNSLLQSLYFTNYFRKAVFKIPTENDDPNNSVSLALQRVFYQLQNSNTTVGTNELTKSFGWDSMDSFMQHDVQEFNRVLQDNLESKMKGTPAEGEIQKLFVGKMKSYITCTDVKYESSRIEDYYDIQLNVKGCKNVRESFENYIEVEVLEGENKYMAEGYGLQDAKKGVIFENFPPVLHLQLKRFDYDFMRDMMVKINDRYEFPESMDLSDFISEDGDRSESWEYELHGVLVHSGDLHGGHYFALLKPEAGGKWYKFDDDRVTFATDNEVFEESFGQDTGGMTLTPGMRPNQRLLRKFSNAYMLVYIRKSKLDEIIGEVTIDDVPHHLLERVDEEKAATIAANKKKSELGLQANFRILVDEDIKEHHGFGLLDTPDVYNIPPSFYNMSISKLLTLSDLKEKISEQYNLRHGKFRLWSISGRENHTLRVSSLINEDDDELSIVQFREKYFRDYTPPIIYVEVLNSIIPFKTDFPVVGDAGPTLLLVKYYDHTTDSLSYIGKLYANQSTKMSDIMQQLNNFMKFPEDTQLEFYDEIKPSLIEPIPLDQSLDVAELTSGDIICFQQSNVHEIENNIHIPGILGYFDELNNRVTIAFKPKSATTNINQVDENTDIILALSKKKAYEEFIKIFAEKLNADPHKIRLYTPNGTRNLLSTPVPYQPEALLENIIRYSTIYNNPAILYYEVLDVTLTELESKDSIQVLFLGNTIKEETSINLLVPKDGTMKDTFNLFEDKLKESKIDITTYRFYETDHSRFTNFVDEDINISELKPHSTLYAEFITEENSISEDGEVLVPVFHFAKEEHRTHGTPFIIKKHKDETLEQFKTRLIQRLGVSEKEFSKYKMAIVAGDSMFNYQASYIENEEEWQNADFSLDHQLGLDHPDRNIRYNRFGEKAIKIFN